MLGNQIPRDFLEPTATAPRVAILGAGINGVALARELLLNGVHVCLIELADVCQGTTAYSSRLVHGGLRYLEYGEFALVKESVTERDRLLKLAPEFVRPIELFIPLTNRLGGIVGAPGRFMGWRWWPGAGSNRPRGEWLVRMGLEMYDLYASGDLPGHTALRVGSYNAPPVNPQVYRSLCKYFDAQVMYPERLVWSMLHDCRRIAADGQVLFTLLTHTQARLNGRQLVVESAAPHDGETAQALTVETIVNATGAWVDATLAKLPIPSERLIGGTRGTHLFLFHQQLHEILGGKGIYAEAEDGRPIFVLPLGDCVMVGTTDEPFDGPPETAVATEAEIAYLLRALGSVFPQVAVPRSDVNFHGCGVRPLPYVDKKTSAGAITRRHWLHRHEDASLPLVSVIGGKLTTCRSLAEEATAQILGWLNKTVVANSRERVLPGNARDNEQLVIDWASLAHQSGLSHASVEHAWSLLGTMTPQVLSDALANQRGLLPGMQMPESVAQFAIEHEQAATLEDLVERRLMLLYHRDITRPALQRLAQMLIDAGRMPAEDLDAAVEQCIARLARHYGKQVSESK
jgi:glycerol-3-phosphate dehydrogenase